MFVFPLVFVRGGVLVFGSVSHPARPASSSSSSSSSSSPLLLPRVLRVQSNKHCCVFVPAVHFVGRGGRESRTHVPSLRRKPPLNRTEGLPKNKRRGKTCKCQTVLDHGYDGKHSFLSAQKNGLRGPCGPKSRGVCKKGYKVFLWCKNYNKSSPYKWLHCLALRFSNRLRLASRNTQARMSMGRQARRVVECLRA